LVLAAALDAPGTAPIGRAAGGVAVSADIDAAVRACDVLIDFTRPAGTLKHLEACLKHRRGIVIGTTGFSEAEAKKVREAGKEIPVVLSPNFAVGVNVLFALAGQAAKALGDAYDVEIIEAHHRHKVDAPSGTALAMGEIVARELGRDLKACAVYGRQGVTGERDPSAIGFATVRGGDIVGDHTALFAGTGERIEITHRSSSRATYAQGSLRAARFLADKPSGLFGMNDVLGL
ncbi:MAG TPA: 4-hydroxy-tetrahydrodipicolinate reductase, partial [Burkholderiaceae bacterium]|nr:4-hydroxy-tetrahydrodipicolinate reductase [Burkholderiaceae bacterium]